MNVDAYFVATGPAASKIVELKVPRCFVEAERIEPIVGDVRPIECVRERGIGVGGGIVGEVECVGKREIENIAGRSRATVAQVVRISVEACVGVVARRLGRGHPTGVASRGRINARGATRSGRPASERFQRACSGVGVRHRGCGEHPTDGFGGACEVALEEQFAVVCVDHDELRLAVAQWQVDLPGRSSNAASWIPNPFDYGAIG